METYLLIVAGQVALTNILVQRLKALTRATMHTNILAVIIAMVLSLLRQGIQCGMEGTSFLGALVPAMVLGLGTAYAAMFGFDKLQEVLEKGEEVAEEVVKLVETVAEGLAEEAAEICFVAIGDMTRAQMKAVLDALDVTYRAKASRAELLALLVEQYGEDCVTKTVAVPA